MSKTQPFAGKWQVLLDTGDINLLIGSMGANYSTSIQGTNIILYQTGNLKGTYLYYGIAQLQPNGVTPTQPGALSYSYLTPIPYSGNIYRPNGNANSKNAQVWAYNDSYQCPTPTFVPNTNPGGAVFGWWNTPPFPQVWGWLSSSSPPQPGTYTMVVKAPSAFHIRDHASTPIENGDYTWCDLSGEDYSNVNMRGAVFAGADLSGTNFTGTDLTGADFRGVYSLTEAIFTNAILNQAQFDGVNLAGCNLSHLTMQGATLTGTNLTNVDFTSSDLSSTDFRQVAAIAGANFTNTILTSSRFDSLNLTGFEFSGSNLTQVNFSGTTLDNVQFINTSQQKCNLSYVDFRQPKSMISTTSPQ